MRNRHQGVPPDQPDETFYLAFIRHDDFDAYDAPLLRQGAAVW